MLKANNAVPYANFNNLIQTGTQLTPQASNLQEKHITRNTSEQQYEQLGCGFDLLTQKCKDVFQVTNIFFLNKKLLFLDRMVPTLYRFWKCILA